jgi:formate dehydrogenase maturation protein FdhE
MADDPKCLVCGDRVDDDGPRICEYHWYCPKCGADVEDGFAIEDGGPGDEIVECEACTSGWDYAGIERDICAQHGIDLPADTSSPDVVMVALPRDVAEALLTALEEVLK